eukprot:scaffold3034_cov110-Skeletonema_dohrnii-CCMP3373.AAC.12
MGGSMQRFPTKKAASAARSLTITLKWDTKLEHHAGTQYSREQLNHKVTAHNPASFTHKRRRGKSFGKPPTTDLNPVAQWRSTFSSVECQLIAEADDNKAARSCKQAESLCHSACHPFYDVPQTLSTFKVTLCGRAMCRISTWIRRRRHQTTEQLCDLLADLLRA